MEEVAYCETHWDIYYKWAEAMEAGNMRRADKLSKESDEHRRACKICPSPDRQKPEDK